MAPTGFFFCFSLYTLSALLCSDCPGFAVCPYHTTHTTKTSMPPAEFELAIPASDWPQTALDRSATGIGRIEPETFQLVAQYLNQLRHLVPPPKAVPLYNRT
jgi:hypothetical protein